MNDAVFDAILADVSSGVPTWKALATRKVGTGTFHRYKHALQERVDRYARAKAEGVEGVVDDAMRIADNPKIKADNKRIQVDLRKWYAAKIAPKVYGEHLHLEHSGNIGNAIGERLASGRKRLGKPD